MRKQNYKVYNATHHEDHTTKLSFDEAVELKKELESCFDDDYEIHPCYEEEPEEPRHYNNNAVDGWEDMFPSYDY